MPTVDKRLTTTAALKLPLPAAGYVLYWCPRTPGFAVRVAASGSRSWVFERRVDGGTKRRTLGRVDGRNGITDEAAREVAGIVTDELATGIDRVAAKREQRAQERAEDGAADHTFGKALREYVEGKRSAKHGKPLSARTRDDYLAMIAAPEASKRGFMKLPGELFALAEKPVSDITADDMRAVHAAALERGQRRATYSMQVLRAVLNWEGVQIEDSPLAKTTAGKQRIALPGSAGNPLAIPRKLLGAWWNAASDCGFKGDQTGGWKIAGDVARLMLITGARPGEIMRTKHKPGLTVGRVNLAQGEMMLFETKNGDDHIVKLSTQAIELIRPYLIGKKPDALVFPIQQINKTMAAINEKAGVDANITPHKLRHTFVSVAGATLPELVTKALVNHSDPKNVTLNNYFDADADVMRAAWQTIADTICKFAAEAKDSAVSNVVALRG